MEIRTFIFFDLETTGLIKEKVMPRITEIALIAVARESICNSNKNSLPRVLHKLVLPINPQKIIPPHVEHLTKLSNEDMQLLQPFECEIYELITRFLQRLAMPICFVAHNGDRFDYPIFLQELERIKKVLDDGILCIDTWKMFQDFFQKRDSEPKIIQNLLNDEYNDSLSSLDIDTVMMEKKATVVTTASTSQVIFPHEKYTKVVNNIKCTDKEHKNDVDIHRSPKNPRQTVNERTPESQIIRQKNVFAKQPFKKYNNPKKRLDFGCERPANLKLSAIYEYMFGSNFAQEHSAEADCLAMIRCVANIADFFLKWSDNHASPLSCYKNT